ncbi:serine acetyltransferase [Thalassotalea sp. HSM 43]|uniref:serine O-acetyltransferase n=1 Tax=Thalassotalea sp. HSM 43 TaxID=2552945 RepID=UPI0010815801|nr:DapH/DapD/GlmU-related protein [Thalassotalea sp. HSM 43]QBY04182.1 serine acetyltransferase [Thalassotalea sp. HSM 43]
MKQFIDDIRQKQRFYQSQGFYTSFLRALSSDGTLAVMLYRLTGFFIKYRLSPLAWLTHKFNVLTTGCVIGVRAKFDTGFILLHPIGVVINSKVQGGRNVVIESGVVIGDEKGQAPVLGDNVFIGSGAKVIGGISIGSNAKVGANAVVVKDVPENATVVGIPAKEIVRN